MDCTYVTTLQSRLTWRVTQFIFFTSVSNGTREVVENDGKLQSSQYDPAKLARAPISAMLLVYLATQINHAINENPSLGIHVLHRMQL